VNRKLVYAPFIATLKLPFKLDRSWSAHKPANGVGKMAFDKWTGAALENAAPLKGRATMFQGLIDTSAAAAVEASAVPDILFEQGLYWASGRSGVVDLVAAHKWFNLAAIKGRIDAARLRREVAELMSEAEIALAQREARAWMTAY
jgi:hypothetical protein